MSLRLGFSQALVLSLALHAAVGGGAAYVLRPAQDDDPPETLVVELEGLLATTQQEEKHAPVAQRQVPQTPTPPPAQQAVAAQAAASAPPSPPQPDKAESDVPEKSASAAPTSPATPRPVTASPPPPPAAAATPPPQDSQKAQVIEHKPDREELLQRYGALLAKKVQGNLVYPDEERSERGQGTVTVAFAIRADGSVEPGSLRTVIGSGTPALDAAALQSIRQSAPFPAPPNPTTISFSLYFGRKKQGGQ